MYHRYKKRGGGEVRLEEVNMYIELLAGGGIVGIYGCVKF